MQITVTQLNRYIKSIIENDIHLANVAVSAELSNFKLHSSGHCYMTLKDDTSTVRAVMFKSAADKLRFRPENGMKVIVTGKVSVYERDGQYQMYLNTMQPDGVGDLHVAYEQLKAKLAQEGLFDAEKKKPLPKFPNTVGVITAPTGAAVRDIVNVITRRFPSAEVIINPVLVQGDGAAQQIADAIKLFNAHKMADVLIVGRGGGSIEDLWAFNEEVVARAIYSSAIPIISAVGHETDFTIADFVADMRAPTPSAAAELAVPSNIEIMAQLKQNYGRMLFSLKKEIENRRSILARFSLKNPMDIINQNRMRTDYLEKNLISSMMGVLENKKKTFAVHIASLDALSPLAVLNRGYAVAQGEKGVIRKVSDINKGDKFSLRLVDGSAKCEVFEIKENENGRE